ncbi:hypothetical protein [Runella sp.]|uniref:hypothetical protein n=1 Tax=Runella sp. TaxID=1960881 RepID=UPI003D0A6551
MNIYKLIVKLLIISALFSLCAMLFVAWKNSRKVGHHQPKVQTTYYHTRHAKGNTKNIPFGCYLLNHPRPPHRKHLV